MLWRVLALALVVSVGCSGELSSGGSPVGGGGLDSGPGPFPFDSGPAPMPDGALPQVDTGPFAPDTGSPAPDAGPPMGGYGPVSMDLGNNLSFTFNVPAGVLGIHFHHPMWADGENQIHTLTDPMGRQFITDAVPAGHTEVFGFPSAPVSSQGLGLGIMPGTWTASLYQPLQTVVTFQQTPTGTFQAGELDINIHFPAGLNLGGAVVSAANAVGNPTLQSYLASIRSMLPRLTGLQVGQVRYFDAGANLSSVSIDSDADDVAIRQMARSQLGMPGVHVLLAQDIPGATVGFASIGSDPRGGGDAMVQEPSSDPNEFASTFVHEFGHYVGLNHTTENDRVTQDQIADTPSCSPGVDDAACPDALNVMFPAFFDGLDFNQQTASPEQRAIYAANALYRAMPAFKNDPLAGAPDAGPQLRTNTGRWVCGHTLRYFARRVRSGAMDLNAPALLELSAADRRRVSLLSQRRR